MGDKVRKAQNERVGKNQNHLENRFWQGKHFLAIWTVNKIYEPKCVKSNKIKKSKN